jgi:hypothetical protein
VLLRYGGILNFLLKYSVTVCGVFTNTVPAGNDRANAPEKIKFCPAEIPLVTNFSNYS